MISKKTLIIFLILSFILESPVFSAVNDNKNTEQSISPIVFSAIGVSISVVAIVMSIFSKPKNIGLSNETFIIKEETLTTNISNLTTFYGLNYKFSDIFEINPSISFNGSNPSYLMDTGICLVNDKILENEINGVSPFFSAGISNYYKKDLNYGAYLKAGILLKLENIMLRFDGGYRVMTGKDISANSATLGGNISYKF